MNAPKHIPDEQVIDTWAYEVDSETYIKCCLAVCRWEKSLNRDHYLGYVHSALYGDNRDLVPTDEFDVPQVPLSAPGGLTYGPDPEGWLGFDYGHAGDYCIGSEIRGGRKEISKYTNLIAENDAREDIETLAEEVAELEQEILNGNHDTESTDGR